MGLQRRTGARVPMEDEQIVALYWQRDEKAIEETDFKYKTYLLSIAYRILHDSLDCEECLNDTYLGTWNAIPPARPNLFKAFLTTVLRRIAVNRYHSNRRKKQIPSEMTVSLSELEEFLADDADVERAFDSMQLGRVISAYLYSLSERRRFIFMSRYYMAEPIDAIARDLNVSRSTVNKELAAIRVGLKKTLEKEGYNV